jgi:hypothetical protein
MQISFKKSDLAFLLFWLAAGVLGGEFFSRLSPGLPSGAWYLAPALSGALRGVLQGLALLIRNRRMAARWALATFIGITAYGLLVGALVEPLRAAGLAALRAGSLAVFVVLLQGVQGAAIGGAQWVALRADAPRPARWVFISGLAYAAAALLGFLLAGSVLEPTAGVWGALASGLVTGLGLVWMLNQADEIALAAPEGAEAG